MAQQDPNRVVATVGGKPLTAKQAVEMLKPLRPEDRKRFETNLPALLQQLYMENELAGEATKMNLDQQSPWKEQLQITRVNILTQAYIAKMSGSASGADDPRKYYDDHQADFEQLKLSGILVAFNPPGTPAASSGTTVQRTEAQALEKANDLEKKIKAGGDFSALARTDSDHQSSTRGGDLGTVVLADANLTPDIKNALSKLQDGQVSEPVRVPGGYYILKLVSRTKIPFEQARSNIVQKSQNEKSQAIIKQELDKYKVQVQDQDFFGTPGASGTPIPSLQRPPSRPSPPATQPPVSKP